MTGPSAVPEHDHERLADLAGRLGVTFSDPSLLARAMVHRSWAFEQGVGSNERLEFLGDAVVGLVAADELYHHCPEEPEGRLAELRAAVVSQPTLAGIAREIGLGEFLRLGVGEAASGGADKDSLLSDTLEAILGAVYLDAGFTPAYHLAQRLMASPVADLLARPTVADPKSALKEHAEATVGREPFYAVSGSGPDHEPTFVATVTVAGDELGRGTGATKKAAEQEAAAVALAVLAPHLVAASAPAPPVGMAGTGGTGRDRRRDHEATPGRGRQDDEQSGA